MIKPPTIEELTASVPRFTSAMNVDDIDPDVLVYLGRLFMMWSEERGPVVTTDDVAPLMVSLVIAGITIEHDRQKANEDHRPQ